MFTVVKMMKTVDLRISSVSQKLFFEYFGKKTISLMHISGLSGLGPLRGLFHGFQNSRIHITETQNHLALVVLEKGIGIGQFSEWHQFFSHGAVHIAADDKRCLPGIYRFEGVVIIDGYGRD